MTEADPLAHLKFIELVARADCDHIRKKEATYQGSWKRRGGVGAFMMLARKWDRLEKMLEGGVAYDIFSAIERDVSGLDGSALAEIRDLRRYLLLVEAEMVFRGRVTDNGNGKTLSWPTETWRPGTPEDGGHHAQEDPLPPGARPASVPSVNEGQLEDGLTYLPPGDPRRYLYSGGYYLVDRRNVPPNERAHLRNLPTRLNEYDHRELERMYQHLYNWDPSSNAWFLDKEYDAWAGVHA